mmetsp:Transcript_31655/g.38772  ORF Transcript_31655/g.38772 Transcript_31655/m.38772 type:complete len:430 (-) Transcript_31655:125-1414(-)|eukprot:CAMPEP_0172504134 /NCGR_PEP_ID=MMETSP1066-20121228/175772_1 /TAXON_ID=671091 /ORGANISM="Coscinodiscus wailesii, Strain CCMP2513" /LENGTH=429 /DNA_ID=CAMNT_0013280159 /DNA_START=183 /DNA_END=1472 /DNA_ORIENTATION=+
MVDSNFYLVSRMPLRDSQAETANAFIHLENPCPVKPVNTATVVPPFIEYPVAITKKKSKGSLWKKAHDRIPSLLLMEEGSQTANENELKSFSHCLDEENKTNGILGHSFNEFLVPVLAYLLSGTVAYSFVFERWPIIDSLYFTVVTFTTVGYGDLAPENEAGKIFTCVFATAGVTYLGFLLGIVGNNIIEANIANVKNIQREKSKDMIAALNRSYKNSSAEITRDGDVAKNAGDDGNHISIRERTLNVLKYTGLFSALLIGSFYIGGEQDWNWVDQIYYLTITSLTIGYGDSSPDSSRSKLFAIFYILFAVGTVGSLVGGVATFVIDSKMNKFLRSLESRTLTVRDLELMDTDGDGQVTKLEFMEFLLLAMEKVDRELLDALHTQFDRFDEHGEGTLSKADLKRAVLKKLKTVESKLRLSDYKNKLLAK